MSFVSTVGIHELPEQWALSLLNDIVTIERGSSPRPIKNYITGSDNGVNWIKIGDVKEGEKYLKRTNEKITLEGAEKSRFVKKGDLILSNSMSLGRPYILEIDGYIHDGWFVFRLPNSLNTDFLYYLLSSGYVQSQFASSAVGGVVKNIRSELVKKTQVFIPSLAEQKEIVRLLDTHLATVTQIQARLDAIPKI